MILMKTVAVYFQTKAVLIIQSFLKDLKKIITKAIVIIEVYKTNYKTKEQLKNSAEFLRNKINNI